jgi:hypothetical protein
VIRKNFIDHASSVLCLGGIGVQVLGKGDQALPQGSANGRAPSSRDRAAGFRGTIACRVSPS